MPNGDDIFRNYGGPTPRDVDYARRSSKPGMENFRSRTPNFDRLAARMRNVNIKRRAERGRRWISR